MNTKNSFLDGILILIVFFSALASFGEWVILYSNEELSTRNKVEILKSDSLSNKSILTDKKNKTEKEKNEISSKHKNTEQEIKEKKDFASMATYTAFKIFSKYGVYIRLAFILSYISLMALHANIIQQSINITVPLSLVGFISLLAGGLSMIAFYKILPKEGLMLFRFPPLAWYGSLLGIIIGGGLLSTFFADFFNFSSKESSPEDKGIPIIVDKEIRGKITPNVVVGVDEQGNLIRENRDLSLSFRTHNGWLNILEPNRGIFVIGNAGAGKTYSLFNPMIRQFVYKGYTSTVYDYKFPDMTLLVHKAFHLFNPKMKLYILNFKDITRSHRCNPIKPELIHSANYADMFAETIIKNLNMGSKEKSYWEKSQTSLLKTIIWFLKTHYPKQCTLAHVIAMTTYSDINHMISALTSDTMCSMWISDITGALERDSGNQLSGVIGTLTVDMSKLVSAETWWLLTGDEFDLNVNDPKDPKWVTIGTDEFVAEALAPIVGLLLKISSAYMNQQDKYPSALILDEAPTVTIPNLHILPTTGRSNLVSLVYGTQGQALMDKNMGEDGKISLTGSLANQIMGQTGENRTAEEMIELMGKQEIMKESSSISNSKNEGKTTKSTSTTNTPHEKDILTKQQAFTLPQGFFLGKTTEKVFSDSISIPEYDKELKFPIYPYSFIDEDGKVLPRKSIEKIINENFEKVLKEVDEIIKTYKNKWKKK